MNLNSNVEGLKEACEEAVASLNSKPPTPDNQDTTVDLCISSDHSEATRVSKDELSEEEDSAIDAGHSEALSSAAAKVNEDLRHSLGQEILRIQQESKNLQLQQQQQQQQSFQPVHLDLSETIDSTDASCGPLKDESSIQTPPPPPSYAVSVSKKVQELDLKNQGEERRKALLSHAAGNVDAKVQEFLNKMRTDKKFEISLSSLNGAGAVRTDESTVNFDLTEESESTALTESKFRQGLEASLDLTTTDNNDW